MAKYAEEILSLFSRLKLQQINAILNNLDQEEIKIFNAKILHQIIPVTRRNQIRKQLIDATANAQHMPHSTGDHLDSIHKKITQEITKPEPPKEPEAPKVEKTLSLWARFINFLVSIWHYSFGSSASKPKQKTKPAEEKPPYTVEISEEEDSNYKAMSQSGREYGEYLTGKSIYGDQSRSPEERALSAGGRFGITLASQVMASSETETHGHLRTIASSLVEANDSDRTARLIRTTVSSPDKFSPFNLKATHVFSSGGDDILVAALEADDIKAISDYPRILDSIGLSFSKEEHEKILKYRTNEERSRQLNCAISDFATSQGGYDIASAMNDRKEYQFKVAPKDFLQKHKEQLQLIQEALKNPENFTQCMRLKYGQSFSIDLEFGTMQISRINTKAGCEYSINCKPPFGLSQEQANKLILLRSQTTSSEAEQAELKALKELKVSNKENLSLALAQQLEGTIYKAKAELLSKHLVQACAALNEDESLYFDTGLEYHAMKIAIKRENGQFKFTCYDSSGALENTMLIRSLTGFVTLQGLNENKAQRTNALTFTVPKDKLISDTGLNYFNNLLRLHSYAGWAEASIEQKLRHTNSQQRNELSTWDRWMALLDQAKVYSNYIKKFTAIAGGPNAATFEPLVQRPQNTDNCFAKRLQSTQLYELGKPTYKKLRAAILLKQKKGLLKDICGSSEKHEKPLVNVEYIHMLKSIRAEFLSPQELHELSRQLCEVQTTPSNDYYVQYFEGLVSTHQKLMAEGSYAKNKMVINRIESKLEHYAKTYYDYLNTGKRTKDINTVFSTDFDSNSLKWDRWRSGKYPFNMIDGKMDKAALALLSGFANAQAWKASIQVLNHQIVKLSVNERHINSASERLAPASLSDARKASENDLINANIVRFVTGSKRDEHIKVELTLGKERKEIDTSTFFKLIANNTQLLTHPKVVSLLEYLRNSSLALGKKFFTEIYPVQHNALATELANKIKEHTNKLQLTGELLIKRESEIKNQLTQCEEKLSALKQEIADEISLLGPGKESTKLKNARALKDLIENKDKPNLQQLLKTVEARVANLLAPHTTLGSTNFFTAEALDGLSQIHADTVNPATARKVINDFLGTQIILAKIENQLNEAIDAIEIDSFESSLNERETALKAYRAQVLTECLQINPQYKILDELSLFKMGTQRDKTPQMYNQEQPSNKVGYVEGSLLDSIHKLNKALKTDVHRIFEEHIILKTSKTVAGIDSLIDQQADYQEIIEQAQGVTKAELPTEIKTKWVNELFRLWIKHEKDETLLALLNDKTNEPEAIQQAFHQFIERHTHLKLAALKEAQYPIDLSSTQMQELGWNESKLMQIKENLAARDTVVHRALLRRKIQRTIQRHEAGSEHTDKTETPVKVAEFLTADQLTALHNGSGTVNLFIGPTIDFISQTERETLDGSTINFLRTNKTPVCDETTKESCASYFEQVAKHLEKLQKHNGLENKNERILKFCLATSANLFTLPSPSPKELLAELRKAVLKGYYTPDSEPGKEYIKAFRSLENEERSTVLSTLIKLSLSEIPEDEAKQRKVSPEFYSMIKQWERLISPPDSKLSEALSQERLSPDGLEPTDFHIAPADAKMAAKSSYSLKAIDKALHESPVGLEGLYEGQKGLQRALDKYATEKGLSAEIRGIADRLGMRNGDSLLANQFIAYFSNQALLLSHDKGINSTPGREFFIRALMDAYQHANEDERIQLLKFLGNLNFGENACKLKVSHAEFRDELFLQCKILDLETFTHFEKTHKTDYPMIGSLIEDFINKATSKTSTAAENRLFGFAKEINYITREIERLAKLVPSANLDQLYSRLICSKLAYQLLLDQATDEELTNLTDNLEYRKEMALVQTNITKLHDKLVNFSQTLSNERAAQFRAIFNQYQTAKKFDGAKITITKMSASDIPGFINLGNNVSLDIIHGAVYLGNSKRGIIPAYIKSHFSLEVLGMNTFPFKKLGSSYVYMEEDANKQYTAKAYIIPRENGELIIQRELKTLGGDKATMLQYLEPEHSGNLPVAIKSRINAEHYFIDKDGSIHAYAHDFTPLLKLSPSTVKGEWLGELLDHNGNKITVQLSGAHSESALSAKLTKLFPAEELLTLNDNTVYLPALKHYITHEDGILFISKSLSTDAARSVLAISRTGVATLKKVRSKPEEAEINTYKKELADFKTSLSKNDEANKEVIKGKILELQQKIVPEYFKAKIAKLVINLANITKNDLVSLQEKQKIQTEIKQLREQIRQIEKPEHVLFSAESPLVKKQEALTLKLREEMNQAFLTYKGASLMEREIAAGHYAQTKVAYLKSMTVLRKMIAESNYLISFTKGHDGQLAANDFQSILYIGKNPEKMNIFVEMLSQNTLHQPLTQNELDHLQEIKKDYAVSEKANSAYCLLIGIELQHYILERELALRGKKAHWNRVSYAEVLNQFSEQIQTIPTASLKHFAELWRAIGAEFHDRPETLALFAPKVTPPSGVQRRALNINTKTSNMPIEAIEAESLIQFTPHSDFVNLIDKSQKKLTARLKTLSDSESIQAQEDGYYYENCGLFNLNTLNKLFKLKPEHTGIGNLSEKNIKNLFSWLEQQGWIAQLESCDKYQLLKHPSEFFSTPKLASYLSEMGLQPNDIQAVIDRLEVFVYEAAANGGEYALTDDNEEELLAKINSAKEKYNLEYLMAQDQIKSVLAQASQEIPLAELHSAYLLNDFRKITEYYPEKDRAQIETVLNNALTRQLFYKTEFDHLNEIHTELNENNNVAKAISMLHIRRNYKLDKLLGAEQLAAVEKDRKMQRAFLLFEYEWGYRCNSRQVDIFRGLLLDDATDPDKIDAAQARMGFGKTSLLPLIALYKTGEKLVRFIVPKSALETNTADMSAILERFGKRAVKDDFIRFKIEKDEEHSNVEDSPRLRSLNDAKAELLKKLTLYKQTIKNHEVLVQAPHVRNTIECQAEIFLDLLLKIENKPDEENALLAAQEQELMACIALINEIRSLTTISVFDELDATQDPLATDVNYTSGEKEAIDADEIIPLETITLILRTQRNKTPAELADLLFKKFGITDTEDKLKTFIINQDKPLEIEIEAKHEKIVYLLRAILSDPALRNTFTQKEPSTDFGVWFQATANSARLYDYSSLSKDKSVDSTEPLLIAVPYSAANTPKPQGSRFDNPEVTAITTFLYYLDTRTPIEEVPHLEFIINAITKGAKETPFLGFPDLYEKLKIIAAKVDPVLRNEARKEFFDIELGSARAQKEFRRMLARAIIQEQIQLDSGKANSNRYEQGTVNDAVIGFSGTAGDTSSHFRNVRLDPAADGNMTLGIMGRKNCQKTMTLNTSALAQGADYTTALIAQLAQKFKKNTRTLIDVGGLCKASNHEVAKAIALALQRPEIKNSAIKNNGVIFYDSTNTKKLLTLNKDGSETVVDLSPAMVKKSERDGSYFTFYDQAHSRGADIKQRNKAEAILTLNFTVTNNDYKQAIMRMRKIIDRSSGQSFSVALPQVLKEKILLDLALDNKAELTGNDIACWLRKKELADNANNVSLIKKELEAVLKNAVLQQQAALTKLITNEGHDKISPKQIAIFRQCIANLNKISPIIAMNETRLKAKYGSVYGLVKKQLFLNELQTSFQNKLEEVFAKVNLARKKMALEPTDESDIQPYLEMEERIIKKRAKDLQEEFYIPSANAALTEVHSEDEAEVEVEAQAATETETETHAFAQVNNEEAVVNPSLQKDPAPLEPVSIAFLNEDLDKLNTAHQLKSMSLLFTEEDPIRCGPSYNKEPLPPIRYFLAREKDVPKIILINQDEANLFKKSSNKEWALYNLTQENEGKLKPEVGETINSLKNPLLKKLLFASFRNKLNTNNLDQLEESLTDLYTRQQLEPTLTIDYQTADEYGLFSFNEWGFAAEDAQTISVSVTQVHDKVFNDKYQKQGIQIQLQSQGKSAELFISSKLKPRINMELEAKTEHPSEKTILKAAKETIQQEYDAALKRKGEIKTEITTQKMNRALAIKTAQEKIDALTARKEAAIKQIKQNLEISFGNHIKQYLNLKYPIQELLYSDIEAYSNNIIINKKKYPTLGEAIDDLRDKHLATMLTKDAVYTSEQLQEKLDLIVKKVAPIAHNYYKQESFYHETSGTFIDSFKAVLTNAYQHSPGTFLLLNFKENLSMWKTSFYPLWKEHFINFIYDKADEARLWSCFESAVHQCAVTHKRRAMFQPEQLEQQILKNVKTFINDPEQLYFFTSRLSYTLNTGDPVKHQAAIETEIEDIIRLELKASMKKLAESHEALAVEAVNYIDSKLLRELRVPERLKKYTDASPATLKTAIEGLLAQQNITVTTYQLEQLTQKTLELMAQYNEVNKQVMDNYVPVINRSAELKAIEGEEPHYIPDEVLKVLTATDAEVLAINEELEQTVDQRKTRLKNIDAQLVELGKERQANKVQVKELKVELSAIKKLFKALENLFAVFAKIELPSQKPIEFLEQRFNLEKMTSLIDDTLSPEKLLDDEGIVNTIIAQVRLPLLKAELQFTPPEYYKATNDINEQHKHAHGLIDAEATTGASLIDADARVRAEAKKIQARTHHIVLEGVLQVDEEVSIDTTHASRTASPLTVELEDGGPSTSSPESHSPTVPHTQQGKTRFLMNGINKKDEEVPGNTRRFEIK